MKTSNDGFQQCYNAQAAVDAGHQLVVATDVTANASDQGELPVVVDAVQETFDAQPETVLADAGYCNERDLTDLEKRGVDGYVALAVRGESLSWRDRHGRSRALHWPEWRWGRRGTVGHNNRCGWRLRTCPRAAGIRSMSA